MKNKYIDLHLHLDGAITPKIAKKLAKIQNIKLPHYFRLKKLLTVSKNCKNLNTFLECFELPCKLLQTEKAITKAVFLVLKEQQRQGVIYTEVRFAPQKHTLNGLTQEGVVLAALKGLKEAGVNANLILCLMRGNDNQKENLETLNIAKKYLVKNGGVTAIDLAGAEALYNTQEYKSLFLFANKNNIPFTIHAGEASGANSVMAAINFGALRIGHGVRAIESKKLINQIIKDKICLEVCISSNIKTNVFKNIKEFPLKILLNQGAIITINTDDPAIINTTIAKEFKLIKRKFGITNKEINIILNNAINNAFTTSKVKDFLKKEING